MGEEYDFFADPRNDAFTYNDLGSSPSNSQILSDINYDHWRNLVRQVRIYGPDSKSGWFGCFA
jgi:hypothetical protein